MFTKFKNLFKKTQTIILYMKSGNVIEQKGIIDWSFTPAINGVSQLRLKGKKPLKIKVESICLSQIECIEVK